MAVSVAVLADVHGNLPALQAVLQDAREHAQRIVCAGDLAWGGPCPGEVVACIREGGYACVLGNTDRTLAEGSGAHPYTRWARARMQPPELEFLGRLPLALEVDEGGGLLVVHSAPGDPARPLPDPTQDAGLEKLFGHLPVAVVVHGHDHRPSAVALRRVLVVGAGSVGQPFDGDPRACYVLLRWEQASNTWHVTHRRVSYDVEESVRLARLYDMPGAARWAESVRRGVPAERPTL